MYQARYGQDLTHLITLQVANHMPVDFFGRSGFKLAAFQRFSYLSGNLFQPLSVILAELGQAQTNNFLYGFDID